MDTDDPIQQLLKSTGWTCDDLLEKLNKYKSQKERKQEVSVESTNEKSSSVKSVIDAAKLHKNVEVQDYLESVNSIKESKNTVSALRKEFSDSDEEEVEVNDIHTNIVNEIIDDIVSADNSQDFSTLIEKTSTSTDDLEEQEEITEVKVIEINDDDDYFEEESSNGTLKQHNLLKLSSEKVQYLETFPRKTTKQTELLDSSDIIEVNANRKNKNQEKESCNTESEERSLVSSQNIEQINCTNVKKSETLSKTKNEPAQPKGKLLCNVDTGNTAVIYERNCEKMLYSKTQIKNSYSNCITLTSKRSNSSSTSENINYDSFEEETTPTDLEDVRNNLKLQLSSLRKRKKCHFLQQLPTKVADFPESNTKEIDDNLESTKKNYPTVDLDRNNETMKFSSKSSNIEKENDQDHNIYTQTNEFGLVILSVEGGIDLEEHNEKAINSLKPVLSATNENSSNTVNSAPDNTVNNRVFQNKIQNDSDAIEDSQVFDEIRRIIRKQKPNSEITEDRVKQMLRKQAKLMNDFRFIKKSVENSANKLIENPNQKNNRLGICGENSQASFANDDTSQTFDKNSPFVSNTLEEFLTENSKLNISYKVPKCGAEEGLTDSYRDESPLLLKKVVTLDKDQRGILRKPKMIKAKTVAQKRKLLEKQRIKELRRQARIMKQQAENVVVGNNSDSVKQNKQSYIEINNKKLWVKGTKPNTCLAKITSSLEVDPSLKQHHRRRKLSLLTELTKKHNEKINYLPGPLSKKSVLQINGHDNWRTETKLLPKIILEVTPKVGLCLPPEVVCRLPKCKGVVTADLAEFALSVLETKKASEEKIFKFPVKYTNNQEKILVKKRKVIPVNYNSAEKNFKEKCSNSVVASVIDDLIRYVEIKEIAPTLIKEEETEYNSKDIELDKMPPIAENISSIIKKPYKKKSKVEMELSRLSCKVVNVEVEETSSDESCNKPYCRLGCICKSLKCDGMITYHCQNVGCMLECKCPREKSIEYDTLMLPPGTDILSRDTVTRIEDEAKKDLAKVEREFTQMVIHTNDKTIVVGTGGRHKTRRSTKAPTKYSDYIDSNFDSIVDQKAKVLERKFSYKECFVSLKRLNLQDIIPYCLYHNTYNCLCEEEYLSSESSVPKKILSKTNSFSEEKTEQNKVAVERKYPKNTKISPSKQLKIYKDGLIEPNVSINSESQPEMLITSTSGRPIRVNKKLKEGFTYSNALDFQLTDCARIRGIPVSMKRNRKYSRQMARKLTKGDFINNITQSDQLKANVFANSSNALEVDILKHQLILELGKRKNAMSVLADNTLNTNKHKRKQIFEVRSDDVTSKSSFNQDLAIQRRKKSGSIPRRNTIIIEPVFDGEIIVDERNMELLQKMGNRTVMEGYARLLPWTALINSFIKGDIYIWCMVDQPSRLLINKSDKAPPKNYIDIRQTSQTTEVILWIKTNKLPKRYHEDHVSFILKQTKDNYEICGLCTKNFNDTNFMSGSNNEKELPVTSNTDKNDVLFKHKDLNGVQQTLCISKDKFKLQELVEENLAEVGETSIQKNKLYMWAALPEIYRMCKWRMVFLNSDFTFLYFTKVRYSIKYTDLLSASNTAKESNCTVILKNSVICNPYDHSSFGIYFDSHYQDRLFIGPYFKQHKEDDIETLRYINQSLVCTESFNKMQGKTDYKCGHWLIERPYSRLKETVDLTNEMPLNKNLKRKVNTDIPQIIKKSKGNHKETEKIIITQNNDLIKVLDSEPKKPEEFNRYIITNIPHLGYLGAFQHDESSEIDVSWPFENKMLRFPSVNSATNFLQSRFSSLLQPVPESFKINIIVMTDIDLEKTKPIDASILSGHYICGEFGCYNIKNITNEFCISKIGTTQEELLRLFARRAQMFVRQKIEELADTVNIPKGESSRLDIVHILSKAQRNIKELKKKEKQSVMEKHELLLRKRELALKAYCLISTLPEKEKLDENWKFRQILRKKSILIPQTVVEPIEIPDSDEEQQKASSQEESSGQKVEKNVHNLSKTVSHDSSFMDQNSDLAEIMLLSNPDSVKVAPTKQSGLLTTSVADTNLHKKVNETLVCQYPSQNNLKSVLKSNVTTTTTNTSTSNVSNKSDESEIVPKPHYLTGIKLVKTNEGKLMLVSDNKTVSESPFKFSSVGGKQLVIKNSQILSIKSISPQNNTNVQTISVPETVSNIPSSPPKTIVLKKSSLLKRPRVLLPKDMMPIVNEMKSNEKSLLKNNKLSQVVLKKHEKLTGSLVEKDETPSKPHVSTGKETVKDKSCDRIIDSNITTENKQPNTFENILQKAVVPESISEKGSDGENTKRDIEISTSVINSNFASTEKVFSEESRRLTTDDKFLLKPPNIDVEDAATSCSDSVPDQSKVPSAVDKESKIVSEKETNRSDSIIENEIKSDNMIEPPKDTVEKPDTNTNSSVEENIGPSCNNEENFLADAVSETFPSKHDPEMSVKNSVYAAALTHTNCAADDNLNNDLLSDDDKKENKKSSNTIEEINYSNITLHCEDKIAEDTLSLTNINSAINSTSKILENVFEDIKENVNTANIISSNGDLNHKMNEVSTPVELTSDANSKSLNMRDLSNNNNILPLNCLKLAQMCSTSPEYYFQENNDASVKSIAVSATNHEKTSTGNNYQDNLIENSNRNSCCNNDVTMCSDESTPSNDGVVQTNNPVSTPVELTPNANFNSSDNMSLNMGDLSNNHDNILPLTSLKLTQMCSTQFHKESPVYSFQENNDVSLKSIAVSDQDNLIESMNRNSCCNNNVTMCSDENTHKNDCVVQINNPVSKIFNPDTLLKICSTAIKTEYKKVNPEDVKNISVSVSVKISTPFNPIKSQKLTASNTIIKRNIREKTHRILLKKDEIRIMKKACKRRTHRKYNAIKRRCKSPVKKLFLKDRSSEGSSKTIWKHQIKKPLRVLGTSRTLKSDEKLGGRTSKTYRKTIYHKKRSSNISVSENQVTAEPDTKTATAIESEDLKSQEENLGDNLEASDKITRQPDFKSSMQISANDKTEKVVVTKIKLPSAYRRSKRIPKRARKCVCTPKNVNLDKYDVMQTTLQTLNKCLPVTEKCSEQFLSDITSSNNFIITKSKVQPYDNDPHCKPSIISHEDAVSKFPPSKRLANIVVHKLETQNCSYINESSKENAKPPTNDEVLGDDIEVPEQISFNDKKIIYLCKNDDVEKMISKVQRGIDANQISAMKKRDTYQESGSETTSESSSQAPVFKRPIKYVAAKLNTMFTLDKAPFSKRVKIFKPVSKPKLQAEKTITVDSIRKLFENLEKKDTEQFRIRREPIQTKDLILASKIFNKEEKPIENITDKSCSSHKTTAKVKDVLKIDKENFMKNTKLAEKCINIGNMKKKLFANICEDSGSPNTCDSKTS